MAMQSKIFSILGNSVPVEYDNKVLIKDYGNYWLSGDMPSSYRYLTKTPYGIVEANSYDAKQYVAFILCNHLHLKGIDSFCDSVVKDLSCFFRYFNIKAFSRKSFPVFNFEGIESMSSMFSWCRYLECVDFTDFSLDSIVSMRECFMDCYKLRVVDFSGIDFSNKDIQNIWGTDESKCCPVLERVVLKECRGSLHDIVLEIVKNSLFREFVYRTYRQVESLPNNDISESVCFDEDFFSGGNRSDIVTVVVTPERYSEVCMLVQDVYEEAVKSVFGSRKCKTFSREELSRYVRVSLPSVNTDSETIALLVEKIREKFKNGCSEKETYASLKEEGASDYEIVSAMVNTGIDLGKSRYGLVSSYCERVIVPQIREALNPRSDLTVGQVAEDLYKSYSQALVDHAIVLYTWEMYPSIEN